MSQIPEGTPARGIYVTEDAVRIDHPDGGCSVVAFGHDWTATVTLGADVAKWLRDRRRGGGSFAESPRRAV